MASFTRESTGEEVVKALHDQVKGKIIVITGTSEKGLGAETAISLAHGSPAQLILLARSENKVAPVIKQIKNIDSKIDATFVPVELDDLDSVQKAVKEIDGLVKHIDILINNAGIMAVKTFQTNKAGIESHFATNHVGHFYLTALLYPKIKAAGQGSRIVNLTSDGYKLSPCRFEDYNFKDGKDYDPWSGYGQSKTANVLFTRYLASKISAHGLQSFVVHPGVIFGTSLATHVSEEEFNQIDEVCRKNTGEGFTMEQPKTIEQGVSSTLVAALDPSIRDESGSYILDCHVEPLRDYASSSENAQRLWTLTEKLVGLKFEP